MEKKVCAKIHRRFSESEVIFSSFLKSIFIKALHYHNITDTFYAYSCLLGHKLIIPLTKWSDLSFKWMFLIVLIAVKSVKGALTTVQTKNNAAKGIYKC